MRPSHQFDPDAYGDPPSKKIGGCSPIMLMLVLGLCLFGYLQMHSAANARRQRQLHPADAPSQALEPFPGEESRAMPRQDRPRSDEGDWSIEEVETTNAVRPNESAVRSDGLLNENLPDARDKRVNPQNTDASPGNPTSKSTERGDWAIEEVESKPPTPDKPKSTKKGDWEIEEVEN